MNHTKNLYNHDRMKKENMLAVLRCVQEHGSLGRKEIKEITGLAWGTVSGIASVLLSQHIFQEEIEEGRGRGRKPGRLDIAVNKNCIIGMDVNGSGITIVLMDLKCNVYLSLFEMVTDFKKEAVLNQIYAILDDMVEKSVSEGRRVLGIGIAMQGSVDSARGVSVYSPYFENWTDVPLQDLLTERYHLPAAVRHSPDCMAVCATWFGLAKEAQNFLLIRLGEAIGMSIMMNGSIYYGFNGNAGEIGHLIVKPDGELCECGRRGCLETIASAKGIRRYIIKALKNGRDSVLNSMITNQNYEEVDMDLIYRGCISRDELCLEAMERMAYYLGISLANVINMFNPEMILLGGTLIDYEVLFIERVREVVKENVWGNSDVMILTTTDKAKVNTAAMGACINIMEEILSGEIDIRAAE